MIVRSRIQLAVVGGLALLACLIFESPTYAQRGRGGGGGGGRMGGGSFGGVGGRMGGGNFGGGNFGGGGRMGGGNFGGGRMGGMPDMSRPSMSNLGGGQARSGMSGFNRPSLGPTSRPSLSGGFDRPGTGNLPGGFDRSNIGAGGNTAIGNRDRGGNLNIGDRPGIGDRSAIGGRTDSVIGRRDNTVIGGRTDSVIGGRVNTGDINIGNRTVIGGGGNTVIGNRPGWGNGWGLDNRPDIDRNAVNAWGRGFVRGYNRGWYRGSWSGGWANAWYMPMAYGATAWGMGALNNAWGYGANYGYANPYYDAAMASTLGYDYAQPIVLGNDLASPDDTAQQPPPTDAEQSAYTLLDQAREAFRNGDFPTALAQTEQAIGLVPDDPALHEFSALCMFALGDYNQAASVLNALLAVAPGMNWTTLSSLYSSVDVYTQQLRALEAHVQQNPNDASALFVLAYQYLVAGHTDAAARVLQKVVAAQPNDQVSARLLQALTASADPASATASSADPASTGGPTTDLVGSWHAESAGTAIDLTIDAQDAFTWKATPQGKAPMTVNGQYTIDGDTLKLASSDTTQGTMAGPVTSEGADQFRFALGGGPADSSGLNFTRVTP